MRRAVTLIELLVSIASIVLLISIVIPAVKYAREVGRNSVCKTYIKNVCYGVTLYYDTYKKIPLPSSIS